ncbi:MAG: PKD domain-containing protein [Actinomycetota bacterium]|nr:PKD domain-containing protein [Actinomycetota bacterium]
MIVRRAGIGSFVGVLLWAMLPALAGAVVVKLPNGQLAGIAFRPGVNPASIPGVRLLARSLTGKSHAKSNGNLDYNGGPVLHSAAPYLIYWDPSSGILAHSRSVLNQYLTDAAAASGTATDVFAVLRQYTDSTGFAAASQTFAPGTQAIVDTQPYPTLDSAHCSTAAGYPNCITDAQLRAEVTRVIGSSLPTGTGPNAPIYFVITPQNVNICNGGTSDCASNMFCAYHSYFTDGANKVLYSTVPFLPWARDPSKGCQVDGTATYQSPNNDQADNIADDLGHELSETITDPLITAWINNTGGNEVGDNCATWASVSNPINGVSANAYLPVLGGTEAAGTLYDQLINGHQYYTQTEWSNGDVNCQATPSSDALTAGFTDTAPVALGSSVSFDPTASSASSGDTITSTTWNFGDGSAPVFSAAAPAVTNHTFATSGTYTVTMTLVDSVGNLATVSHTVEAGIPPASAFTATPSVVLFNSPVGFNGTGSSDPNPGGSITGYSWNFGDGSPAGSGATPQHPYAAPGQYTVTLTVTDALGLTGTVSHQVTVVSAPTAAFTVTPARGGVPLSVAFNGTGSSGPSPITGYGWNFGDGSAPGSGGMPSHVFAKVGSYAVKLIVIDSLGLTGSVSRQVLVLPTAVIHVLTPHPRAGAHVAFDGSSSQDPGGRIVAYSWSFGDGHTSSHAKPSHTYARSGGYRVTLTVTDASGLRAAVVRTVGVRHKPSHKR